MQDDGRRKQENRASQPVTRLGVNRRPLSSGLAYARGTFCLRCKPNAPGAAFVAEDKFSDSA